jgi:chemotaxis protein methyltransferase WspC
MLRVDGKKSAPSTMNSQPSTFSTAIECYRKALYLQPNHYESLLQLALLLEKNGEATEARTLKRRAQRLQQKGGEA